MELMADNCQILCDKELMEIKGGGPVSAATLVLGAFGIASAGVAIGVALGAAYYYYSH
ncbi:MAG: hypothetical protein KGY44_05320 [Halanaerobiales bacterium]|nr:hypothetical protein [Halanaerobiales bacterium]